MTAPYMSMHAADSVAYIKGVHGRQVYGTAQDCPSARCMAKRHGHGNRLVNV